MTRGGSQHHRGKRRTKKGDMNINWCFFSCVVVVCTVSMWASHLPPHVHGHSMSLLKLHLWCVWMSGMFLIYCHTTKTSGV